MISTTVLAGRALAAPGDGDDLFERITARIYRFFLKQVWDAGEAEELAQRTLLALERSLRTRAYDPTRSFNVWIWLKAHDQLALWYRERARRPERLPDDAAIAVEASHEDEVAARLDAATLLRAVQRRLGEETWEIFVLRHEAGLTQAEIAELLGRDRKTIRTRLRSARALIENAIAQSVRPRGEDAP